MYPEIYSEGTSEGAITEGYFEKWDWYASLDRMAHGKHWNYVYIEELKIHPMHLHLAHMNDKRTAMENLRKAPKGKVTQL